VDDSPVGSAKLVVDFLSSKFKSVNCRLRYVKGSGDELPTARNLGVKSSEGEIILFLGNDTLLGRNVVSALAKFMRDNPVVLGGTSDGMSQKFNCQK
jgi:cellulose synthase/poly-beta-1,6-N-acetylglucosamine synthase-like glycosyltransferase